eukprot:422160_1
MPNLTPKSNDSAHSTINGVPPLEQVCSEEISHAILNSGMGLLSNLILGEGFLIEQILYLLDGDSIAYVMVVCKTLFRIAQSEPLWQNLCERCYPLDIACRKLNIAKWKSYQSMYSNRPRVRTNGMYCMKSTLTKRPHVDIFTEAKPGELLIQEYWRIFVFNTNGTLSYFLLKGFDGPSRAEKLLKSKDSEQVMHGRYIVLRKKGREWYYLNVSINTSFSRVNFKLRLKHGEPVRGHFTQLTLLHHWSSAKNDPLHQVALHSTPGMADNTFTFHRVWDV